MTDKQSNLLRLGHMVDPISKMNERNLFSQAKSWKFFFFFLQMMNFEFSNKIRIPKSGIVLHKLDSFLYLTTLLMMSLVVMLTNVIFWYYIIKRVNIWKICIPQWDHYFPNDWCTQLQNHALVKRIYSKCNIDQWSFVLEYESLWVLRLAPNPHCT